LFLNGIGGLGAPFWVPDFPSRFEGDGDAWQRAVAIAESVVFLLMANLERLQTLGEPAGSLVVTGGLAAYDALCQRLADLSGLSLWRPNEREATARGLAYLVAGCPGDWEVGEGVWFMPAPNLALAGRYAKWGDEMELELAKFGMSM
jgi:glycerol kinase